MGNGWLQAWEGREDAVGVLTGSYFFCSRGSGGHLKVDQKHQLHLHYLDGFPPIFVTFLACFVHIQSLLIYYIQNSTVKSFEELTLQGLYF